MVRASTLGVALFAALLSLLLLAIGIAWVVPPAPGVGGGPHPDFSTLSRGGPGAARHASLLPVGWAFGALSILNFVLLIAFAVRRSDHLQRIGSYLVAGFLIYLGVFTWLMAAYARQMDEPAGILYLGFPLPTAIMLYILFPISTIFNILFVVGFRSWVLTEEDEARYLKIVETHQIRAETGEPD